MARNTEEHKLLDISQDIGNVYATVTKISSS